MPPTESSPASAVWPRILPIASSHNLRDLGGYPAADGSVVRWRRLYRAGLTRRPGAADQAALAALGLAAIVDLRDNEERRRRPTEWHEPLGISYWSRDYDLSIGSLEALARQAKVTEEAVRDVIHDVYRRLPYEQAGSYRALFQRLAAGELPLLFNCSAGKDRTGIAAALVLSALGVPRPIIVEDYALTDHALDRLVEIFLGDPKLAGLAALPSERYLPMLRADPAYLGIMFAEIEERHGTVAGYLDEVLDVGPTEIAVIRDALLERPAPRRR